jgi:N-acetylglucosaminyldiphosphoundecaprenol N-acetyl-beta-D-mannosaminyltransferase
MRLGILLNGNADPSANDPHIQGETSLGVKHPFVNILGVAVDALDLTRALSRVSNALQANEKGYVCAIGVHGILEALSDPCVARAFEEAAIVVPDGMPMVWIGHLQGHRGMRHVTGPALMREIFNRQEFAGYTHFLYGGREGVADELAARLTRTFPGTRIVGTYTPPYRDLTRSEELDVITTINTCRPDMIWVGVSTPRQELLMRRLLPRLNVGLMFGVGAAFDFHTGRIRDCPAWLKLIGFQWLHRLMQDPRRLWRRNLGNASFIWHITLQVIGLRKVDVAAPLTVKREQICADD